MIARESRASANEYNRLAEGNSDWGMGYGDGVQAACFQVIVDKIDLRGKKILDIACGRGDFKSFLDKCGISYAGYMGVDGSLNLVRQGREKHKGIALQHIVWPYPSIEQLAGLYGQEFDVAIIASTLYQLDGESAFSWLKLAYGLVNEAIALDWLVFEIVDNSPAFSNPMEVFNLCMSIGPTAFLGAAQDRFWLLVSKTG